MKSALSYPAPGIAPFALPATVASWGAQLHRRVQLLRHHFYGNLFERRAKLEVSFAVQPQEVDGSGLPGAKRRDGAAGAGSLTTFWQQKVVRLAGRDPPSVRESGMLLKQRFQEKQAFNPIPVSADSYQR